MEIQIRYHALLREETGRATEAYRLPAGARVRDLLKHFRERHPSLARLLPSLKVAVNESFADPADQLQAGDRVDLLPPFGGG